MNTARNTSTTLSSAISKIASAVGNTPLMSFETLSSSAISVYAKAEWRQIGGSVKARAAFEIIRKAIHDGELDNSVRLLDASSGNTAIAYAIICKHLGLQVTICLPQNATLGRIQTLDDLGVEIVYTSPFEGTEGAQLKAIELNATSPDKYFYADQYNNPNNWKAHYDTTAIEILKQTQGRITHFVAGLGTTGTFTGTARRLKEEVGCVCIALQPDSPMHIMEGWKHLETARIPGIYDSNVPDEVITVSSEDTIDMMRKIEETTGQRLSPSSAANLVGATIVAEELNHGVIVAMLPDSIERYRELEIEIFEQ